MKELIDRLFLKLGYINRKTACKALDDIEIQLIHANARIKELTRIINASKGDK